MYHTINRTVRFGINPQAAAMKLALQKREEARAYKEAYTETMSRFQSALGPDLINEMLRENAPKPGVSDALMARLSSAIESIRYYQSNQTPHKYALELLLSLRKRGEGNAPPVGSPGSKAIQMLIGKYLPKNYINASDLDFYRPAFNEEDEAAFLKTLKQMCKTDKTSRSTSLQITSVPLLADIIDYAQSNPPNNPALTSPKDVEIFAAPLVSMVKEGAGAYSMSADQTSFLSPSETTRALVDLFQKKGYLLEDGVKLLPENLADAMFEILAIPEDPPQQTYSDYDDGAGRRSTYDEY